MSEDKNLLKPGDKEALKPENIDDIKVIVPGKIKEEKNDSKDDIIDKLIERINRLEKTANKKRLDNFDRVNDEDPETIYKLRTIDGKVIIKWSDLHTNKAEVDPVTKKIVEDQSLTVYYEDETKEDMSLVIFNRRYQYIYTTLIEETSLKGERNKEKREQNGDRIFTVETEEGKKYIIGENFIN